VEVEHVEDSRTRDANQGVPRKWRGYTKLAAGSGAHEGGTTNTEEERLQILKRKGRSIASSTQLHAVRSLTGAGGFLECIDGVYRQ
jgi:hypothetical protein